MSDTLTRGERNALVAVWMDTEPRRPYKVQWRTLWNLVAKGLLKYERAKYGVERWWLTDAGKAAIAKTEGV